MFRDCDPIKKETACGKKRFPLWKEFLWLFPSNKEPQKAYNARNALYKIAIVQSRRDEKDWLINVINISVASMALQLGEGKPNVCSPSSVLKPAWVGGSVLFFSHCGALGDFITNSPPAFGFYLCQVNWTEESGGKLEPAIFGSFRPRSALFAPRRWKSIPVPFYPAYSFLLVFPLSSHELIFM